MLRADPRRRRQRLHFPLGAVAITAGLLGGTGCGAEEPGAESGAAETQAPSCADGVCVPGDDDNDGPEGGPGGGTADDEGPADGTGGPTGGSSGRSDDSGSTTTGPPDGTCEGCGPWEVPATPDGTATRVCGDPDCTDADKTADLPALDENFYRCRVQPVLEQGCGLMGCHSLETETRQLKMYARWNSRQAPIHSGSQDIEGPLGCSGGDRERVQCGRNPLTSHEWAWNYDTARLFALGLSDSSESELLTQPLAGDAAGHGHDGLDIYANTADVRYQAIKAWLDGGTDVADCGGLRIPRAGSTAFDWNNFECPACMPCMSSSNNPGPCDPTACQ